MAYESSWTFEFVDPISSISSSCDISYHHGQECMLNATLGGIGLSVCAKMVQCVCRMLPLELLDCQWYYMSVINVYIGIDMSRVYAECCPLVNMMVFDILQLFLCHSIVDMLPLKCKWPCIISVVQKYIQQSYSRLKLGLLALNSSTATGSVNTSIREQIK